MNRREKIPAIYLDALSSVSIQLEPKGAIDLLHRTGSPTSSSTTPLALGRKTGVLLAPPAHLTRMKDVPRTITRLVFVVQMSQMLAALLKIVRDAPFIILWAHGVARAENGVANQGAVQWFKLGVPEYWLHVKECLMRKPGLRIARLGLGQNGPALKPFKFSRWNMQ